MDVVTCRYPLTRELLCRASDVRYRARGRWVRLACAAVGGLAGLYLALSAAGSFRTYFWQPPLATALLIGGLTAALWGNRLFLWRGLRGLRRPCRRGAEATLILSPQGLVWRAPGLQVEAEPGGWQVLETGELLVFLVGRRCIPLPKNALPAPSEEALTQLRQWSGGRWRRCPATPCPALWRRWEEGWSRRFPAGETPPWRAAQLRPYGRVFLWAALVLGGGQLCYYAAVVGERGCRYLWPWLAPLLNGLTLLAALGAALCLARRSGLGRALLAAFLGALLGVNAVCAAADALTTHRLIAPSPDFRQVVVLRRNTASGRMIFYRSVGGVFIRPETSLQGWLEGGEVKLRWLRDDVCAVSYRGEDRQPHAAVFLFGGREGRPLLERLEGRWQSDSGKFHLTYERGIFQLRRGGGVETYSIGSCKKIDRTAVALFDDKGVPHWIVLPQTPAGAGEGRADALLLYQVALDETEPVTLSPRP